MRIFYLLLALLVVVFLFLPLALGGDSYLTILDNLDSEFVYLHVLKASGLLFSTSPTEPVQAIMNGLPRNSFHSEFNIIRVLFLVLPSFHAYTINGALVRVIGFFGAFLLTKDYLLKEKEGYAPYIAFMFACMPLYTIYGLSVSGLPFLLWAFLELRNNPRRVAAWMVVIIFPFYAHFALTGPFIILFFTGYGFYNLWSGARMKFAYWIGVGVLGACFILSEVSLITSYFMGQTASHRSSWNLPVHSLPEVVKEMGKIFIRGHYHAGSFFAIPIYLMIFSSMYSAFRQRSGDRRLYIVILLLVAFSTIYPAYGYVRSNAKDFLPVLMSFQFNRFIFLIPLLWLVGLAIAMERSQWRASYIRILLFLQLGLMVYSNNELKMNAFRLVGIPTGGLYFDQPSFNEFFEPALFAEIGDYIAKPKEDYRVMSVGMHPAVAQYNGFYTLDSYQNNYPLSYKTEFRKIISRELDKDESLKVFFDDWGSRCYLFSAEIWRRCKVSYETLRKDDHAIANLEINSGQIKTMGGMYIFSALPIENFSQSDLTLEKKFSHQDAAFDVYLYRINE